MYQPKIVLFVGLIQVDGTPEPVKLQQKKGFHSYLYRGITFVLFMLFVFLF